MAGVRPARARDLDRVVALWTALVDHHRALDPHWETAPGAEEAWQGFVARLLEDADAAVLVWEEAGGGLCGFCVAQVGRRPPVMAEQARCEITDLFVREDARRAGVATALVRAALAWSEERGVRRVEARVASANAPGQGFWRAAGFEEFVDVLQRRL